MFLDSNEARPVGYAKKAWAGHTSRKSWASTTMIVGGVPSPVRAVPLQDVQVPRALRVGGTRRARSLTPGRGDLHPSWLRIFYLVGMTIVGFHLWHGVASALQSLGIDRSGWAPTLRKIGWTLAVILAPGFFSIPLYFFFLGVRS